MADAGDPSVGDESKIRPTPTAGIITTTIITTTTPSFHIISLTLVQHIWTVLLGRTYILQSLHAFVNIARSNLHLHH